jgi:hypothetical protein
VRNNPEFFTEGNEGNEGRSDPSKIQSLFSSLPSVKIAFSNGTQIQTSFPSPSSAENLFLQKETKLTKVFAAGQEQSLCFLRYPL